MKEKSGSRKRTRSSPSSSSDTCKKEQSTSVLSRKPLEKSTPMSLDDQSSPASVGQTSVGFIIPKFILNYVFANVSKTGFFIYLSVLCGLAFAADWREFPELFFFKTKKNFLNLYFVKLGWGWTSSLLGLFICLTSYAYNAGDRWWSLLRHLSRLAVGTVWWLLCTRLFDYLHETFCQCHPMNSPSLQQLDGVACENAEKHWYLCHVSGHAFLLVYCLLLISEELQGYVNLANVQQSAEKPRRDGLQNRREPSKILTICIQFAVVALVALALIWHVMLLATAAYFHHWYQKAIGCVFGVIGWYLTYRVWYVWPALQPWSPGPPGKGLKKRQ